MNFALLGEDLALGVIENTNALAETFEPVEVSRVTSIRHLSTKPKKQLQGDL